MQHSGRFGPEEAIPGKQSHLWEMVQLLHEGGTSQDGYDTKAEQGFDLRHGPHNEQASREGLEVYVEYNTVNQGGGHHLLYVPWLWDRT
jgi:hypothetical protein